MEIVIPSEPGMEFDFNSPHPSAPSSPKRFGQFCYSYYTSAPTSPSRISEFYQEFDNLYAMKKEMMDGDGKEEENEFAFNFSAEMDQSSSQQLTAEELFDGGKIRSLKPPPRSPKKIIRDVFSPRNKNRANPFSENSEKLPERGRQRRNDALSSGSRRAARSLSPYRISEYSRQDQEEKKQPINSKPPPPPPPSSASSTKSSSSRKWRFTDFLLFRSASEGRGTDKDPLRKYSGFRKNNEEGSGSGRRKGQVSAHELHYTKNKAASQDLKKKTFLPYKSGILGFRI